MEHHKYFSLLFCRHETSSGYYRVSVYFIAKVITDLIVMRTFPLSIFCAITYFMIGKLNVDIAMPHYDNKKKLSNLIYQEQIASVRVAMACIGEPLCTDCKSTLQ